ncbi:MAG: hypothetical protein IJK99_09095 [Bacteroidales bacterium]|nr:hypothetical protein [Bacteroidales bacterium]
MAKKLTFENSRRVLERKRLVDSKIQDIIFADLCRTEEEVKNAINECLIENAKKLGMSLYDICFTTVPEVYIPAPKIVDAKNLAMEKEYNICIRLTPIEFELEKGPGYWKNKYLRLKEKVRDVIDNDDEQ